MSRYGPPRVSDPDSWEGRMARRQWERYLVEQDDPALHGTFANEGFELVDFTDGPEPVGSPWIRLDPERDAWVRADPNNDEAFLFDGVDISEYVESFGITHEEAADSFRHMIEAAERAVSDVRGAIVGVRLYRIEDGMEVFRVEQLHDEDLAERPLTEEDYQRWRDEIDDQPTYQGFDATSEPQSDDMPDLLDQISKGVKEWGKEKDRGDT